MACNVAVTWRPYRPDGAGKPLVRGGWRHDRNTNRRMLAWLRGCEDGRQVFGSIKQRLRLGARRADALRFPLAAAPTIRRVVCEAAQCVLTKAATATPASAKRGVTARSRRMIWSTPTAPVRTTWRRLQSRFRPIRRLRRGRRRTTALLRGGIALGMSECERGLAAGSADRRQHRPESERVAQRGSDFQERSAARPLSFRDGRLAEMDRVEVRAAGAGKGSTKKKPAKPASAEDGRQVVVNAFTRAAWPQRTAPRLCRPAMLTGGKITGHRHHWGTAMIASAVTHRTIEANGIHLHIAEQSEGPRRRALSRLSRVLVLVAAPTRRPIGGRLPRRRTRHARLRPVRSAGRDRPIHAAASCRRHGRSSGCARRRDRRRLPATMGRAGRMACGAAAPGPLPRRDRAERAISCRERPLYRPR